MSSGMCKSAPGRTTAHQLLSSPIFSFILSLWPETGLHRVPMSAAPQNTTYRERQACGDMFLKLGFLPYINLNENPKSSDCDWQPPAQPPQQKTAGFC